MSDQGFVLIRTEGTFTWNVEEPVNSFSFCTYEYSDGRVLRFPIAVAGDKITVEYREMGRSEA